MCLSRWCIGGVSVSYVLIFMSATSENNKRIAKNTLFLYMRMLLIMGVTLYTSRIVLQVLGVEDFGIYNGNNPPHHIINPEILYPQYL